MTPIASPNLPGLPRRIAHGNNILRDQLPPAGHVIFTIVMPPVNPAHPQPSKIRFDVAAVFFGPTSVVRQNAIMSAMYR